MRSKVIKVNNDKKKTQHTESVTFDEDGETVHMEINDDGAAAIEFQSEDERTLDDHDSDTGSEQTDQNESEPECGEIQTDTEGSESTETEDEQPQTKKRKSKLSRRSVEDQLSTMSNTLMAMRELLMKKGISTDLNDHQAQKKQGGNVRQNVSESESETTVYHNVLDKIVNKQVENFDIEPEISFKLNKSRGQWGQRKRE